MSVVPASLDPTASEERAGSNGPTLLLSEALLSELCPNLYGSSPLPTTPLLSREHGIDYVEGMHT